MDDVFDGLSGASGVYSGPAVGGRNRRLFYADLSVSGIWAVIFSLAVSARFFLAREPILQLFTELPEVLNVARDYSLYINIFPPITSAGIGY